MNNVSSFSRFGRSLMLLGFALALIAHSIPAHAQSDSRRDPADLGDIFADPDSHKTRMASPARWVLYSKGKLQSFYYFDSETVQKQGKLEWKVWVKIVSRVDDKAPKLLLINGRTHTFRILSSLTLPGVQGLETPIPPETPVEDLLRYLTKKY